MSDAPILCSWDGEVFRPINSTWAKRADAQFTVGERYQIEAIEPRSMASHSHFFAALNEAFANLPEDIADQYPNVETLRKRALIKVGYRDERSIACSSKAEAQRIAAFVKPMDSYAVVLVRESVVLVYTAKSQSLKAMGRTDFEDSKRKVLDVVSSLIGTSAKDLQENQS